MLSGKGHVQIRNTNSDTANQQLQELIARSTAAPETSNHYLLSTVRSSNKNTTTVFSKNKLRSGWHFSKLEQEKPGCIKARYGHDTHQNVLRIYFNTTPNYFKLYLWHT